MDGARCPVGRCNALWQPALDETRALLGMIDPRLADSLAVERKELPISRAEPIMAALRPDKQVGRRDFLRRMVGAVEPRDPLAESRRVVFGRGLVSPLKRERILDRIGALAANLEQTIPASLMPAIKIADGCDFNGLCAAVCPTGALRRNENNGTIFLEFDAADCITCGECQRVCPSKALSLWSAGDGTMPDGPTSRAVPQADGWPDAHPRPTSRQQFAHFHPALRVLRPHTPRPANSNVTRPIAANVNVGT